MPRSDEPTRMTPNVSVVIPLFNKRPYIERALKSVLTQTMQDFEVIVVDDGSTDCGADFVHRFADSRIRLLSQENAGVSAARNRGIAESRSDLVAFLDADDEWTPLFLETVVGLASRFPDSGAYATAYSICTPESAIRSADIRAIPPSPWEGYIPRYFLSATLGEPPVSASSVAVPRAILEELGGFRIGDWWGEDSDMWGRIALQAPIAFSRAHGAIYHTDATERACTRIRPVKNNPFITTAENAIRRGEVPASMLPDVQEYIAVKRLQAAGRNIQAGRPDLARKMLAGCKTSLFLRRKLLYLGMALIPARLYFRYRAMKHVLVDSIHR